MRKKKPGPTKKRKVPKAIHNTDLTFFQKRFVEEYLASPANAAMAARKAGSKAKYPEKVANNLLKLPRIIELINERRISLGDDGKKPERAIEELEHIAFAKVKDSKISHSDKLKALDMICRILALYNDKPGKDEDNPLVVKVINYGDPQKSGN